MFCMKKLEIIIKKKEREYWKRTWWLQLGLVARTFASLGQSHVNNNNSATYVRIDQVKLQHKILFFIFYFLRKIWWTLQDLIEQEVTT